MVAPVVGVGTLRRLSELDTDGSPVLSVYLNLGTPTAGAQAPAMRRAAIEALMSGVAQRVGKANADRVREQLRSMPGLAAPREMWPVIEGALHSDLRDRLTGLVALDLEHASTQEITHALAAVVTQAECEERERCRCSTITAPLVSGTQITAEETTTRYPQRLGRGRHSSCTPGQPVVAPVLLCAGRGSPREEAACP